MAKYLAQLLGEPEAQFSRSISQLELGSGSPGIDIRLAGEIREKLRKKIVELGLDPIDSTAVELYFGLKAKVGEDDAALTDSLVLQDNLTTQVVIGALARAVAPFIEQQAVWVIKKSVIKQLLKK